mmetsp:Transcript_8041/g.25593  ORF Transcript_8041/g.25593 Transcript_8041/m.25593 type:complete len:388 (-) Transcript_8041:60-1223(-)
MCAGGSSRDSEPGLESLLVPNGGRENDSLLPHIWGTRRGLRWVLVLRRLRALAAKVRGAHDVDEVGPLKVGHDRAATLLENERATALEQTVFEHANVPLGPVQQAVLEGVRRVGDERLVPLAVPQPVFPPAVVGGPVRAREGALAVPPAGLPLAHILASGPDACGDDLTVAGPQRHGGLVRATVVVAVRHLAVPVPLAAEPLALVDAAVGVAHHPEAVHVVVLPAALVLVAVRPHALPAPVALAVQLGEFLAVRVVLEEREELAVVEPAVCVGVLAFAVHDSRVPRACVLVAVGVRHGADAVELVVLELAYIHVPGERRVYALPLLPAAHILALVPRARAEYTQAAAVRNTCGVLAAEGPAFLAIVVHAEAVELAILELAFVRLAAR